MSHIKNEAKKRRLDLAMKKNISRRKESVVLQDDIDALQSKINKISSNGKVKKNRMKGGYSEVMGYIIDLFAGGIAGFTIGYTLSLIFAIDKPILTIVLTVCGIMGGFYNIVKRSYMS